MPKAEEIAVVKALGQTYDAWTSIEVIRNYDDVVADMRLTVAEPTDLAHLPAVLKLKPNDPAQGYLAGRLVISGYVYSRQAGYDAKQHTVHIAVCSNTQKTVISTVDGNPGQYKNYTLTQIASAVFGKVGVGFQIVGSPAGANKPFERASEHIGETRYQFIERLCRMRNLQMIDDGSGNILATRGPMGGVGANLVEGKNIKRAQLRLSIDRTGDWVRLLGQNFGTDDHNGDKSRDVSATASDPEGTKSTPITVCAEQPCDAQDAQMRVMREVAFNSAQYADGAITVPGWLRDDGSVWMEHVGELVTIDSPMLLPENTITLWIKGVIHRQNDENGTETDVLVSSILASGDQAGFGGGVSGDPSPSTAQPDGPDTGSGPG